jgi:integrase/recombinase XerD
MSTNITLSLDKRRKKQDNTYPIILRLSHLRKTTSLSLGHSINVIYWDSKNKLVKKSYKGVSSVKEFNNKLLKEKIKASDIINELSRKNDLNFYSIKQIKSKIIKPTNYDSFLKYGFELVHKMKISKRYGSARSYSFLLKLLKKYNQNNDLKFYEINYEFLKKFELNHFSKGNSLNGLASYMRTIRAIFNKAIKEGLIDQEAYPFKNYKIRTKPTEKRALDLYFIKRIVNLKIDSKHKLFHYRNYFITSYMLYGMSFIDMAFLKMENIIDGRAKFQRKKTSKVYDIKLTDKLKEILASYIQEKEKDDYVFPIIKREPLELKYKDVEWARKKYNKGLKDIAKLCEIDQNLTSYVSRHSFATNAMLQNIPLQAISTMLGHSKLNTTQIYLKTLPNNILDDYNEKLSII